MIRFIVELLVMGLIVLAGAYIVPGVNVEGFGIAIIVAVLIALANATIGLVLRILTFPINFITLGLFSFIITVLMVLLVARVVDGFSVSGFWSAAVFAIVAAVLKAFFKILSPKEDK